MNCNLAGQHGTTNIYATHQNIYIFKLHLNIVLHPLFIKICRLMYFFPKNFIKLYVFRFGCLSQFKSIIILNVAVTTLS